LLFAVRIAVRTTVDAITEHGAIEIESGPFEAATDGGRRDQRRERKSDGTHRWYLVHLRPWSVQAFTMIEKILFAVEGNKERMLPLASHAAEIAAGVDAAVVLLHVFEQTEFDDFIDQMDYVSGDPDDVAKRHTIVEACASEFTDREVPIEIVGAVGDPATEITERAESDDIDHVVLGGRNRSPTGKALLGSVSQFVLRSTDVPCTIAMD
jgi:nucleotide-binding universal stress UspA family protein